MNICSKIQRLLLCIGLVTSIGCGNGGSDDEARVRVFHASPDAPNVDVLVDGGTVLENLPFTAASEFLPIDAGDHLLEVNVTGTDTTVISAHSLFEKDQDYMVVAAGKVASIFPLVFSADRSEPESGTARVRVLHAAPSAPNVDVYVTAPGAGITGTDPVLSNVPFKVMSDYLPVPAGTYDIAVTVAGTKTIAIRADGLEIADGLAATVAALDATGGGAPFTLQVLDERK